MAELKISEGSLADKNRGSKIVLENGEKVEKETSIYFENLDGITLEVDGFFEVRSDDVDTWIHLHSTDSSDSGISGVDMGWRELAERIEFGDAEIVDE